MARLASLKPSIGGLPARVGAPPPVDEAERTQRRDQSAPWRRWYKTARWRRLRLEVFARDDYQCQCGCGTIEGNTSLLVCDHVEPHRGDEVRFWAGPFQTLLKECHDGRKQREEQASLHHRGVWD